ncbi:MULTISPECIES: hypothetical protein [Nostoc]|uniref:MarR family transcriptional regulator n=1 Tax=Nostoc paludosum FACHB-159 TaxID=2692908 RepID=A0ABR8KGU6_9NOSO|nr:MULTISPECIES: hypothetical protein [Nostoc]MBD2682422.1 hypothetical protein [Nostoc sp. FACHB-857]MBD2738752.1 hypothetical protein [Nostoc paludosum FACHB-159]
MIAGWAASNRRLKELTKRVERNLTIAQFRQLKFFELTRDLDVRPPMKSAVVLLHA